MKNKSFCASSSTCVHSKIPNTIEVDFMKQNKQPNYYLEDKQKLKHMNVSLIHKMNMNMQNVYYKFCLCTAPRGFKMARRANSYCYFFCWKTSIHLTIFYFTSQKTSIGFKHFLEIAYTGRLAKSTYEKLPLSVPATRHFHKARCPRMYDEDPDDSN